MFLKNYGTGMLYAVFQQDHADMAGQLAANWGNDEFSKPFPYEEMVYATSIHDMSWLMWDYFPARLKPDGTPLNWTELRRFAFDEYSKFYQTHFRAVAELHPYAGLIIVMHAAGLYTKGRYGTQPSHRSAVESSTAQHVSYAAELERLKDTIKEKVAGLEAYREAADEKVLWTNYKLIQVWDRLSQYILGRDDNVPGDTIQPVPRRYDRGAPGGSGEEDTRLLLRHSDGPMGLRNDIYLSPYPFSKEPMVLHLLARLIPDRQYADEKDLARELLRSERIDIRIVTHRG